MASSDTTGEEWLTTRIQLKGFLSSNCFKLYLGFGMLRLTNIAAVRTIGAFILATWEDGVEAKETISAKCLNEWLVWLKLFLCSCHTCCTVWHSHIFCRTCRKQFLTYPTDFLSSLWLLLTLFCIIFGAQWREIATCSLLSWGLAFPSLAQTLALRYWLRLIKLSLLKYHRNLELRGSLTVSSGVVHDLYFRKQDLLCYNRQHSGYLSFVSHTSR